MFFYFSSCPAQFYLRGEIKDEKNNLLPNVKILLHSSGYVYYSGGSGAFGIPLVSALDSVTLSADGFQTVSVQVSANVYEQLVLRSLYAPAPVVRNQLMSITKNMHPDDWDGWTVGAETYSSLLENQFVPAGKFPETGFALNIDKASYSNIRRFINMGSTVPHDAIRIEEMLNYFNFDYTAPVADSNFSFGSVVSECPWNADNLLLYLRICARKADMSKTPPANLVFLIDVSGSMDMPNRLPLLKSAFSLLVNNLRTQDTVSIVVYGSALGVWLPPTPGDDKAKILKAIEELSPGGATPGEAGIRTAYNICKDQYIPGGNNRVILATDGDFNVGQSTEDELEKLIVVHRQWGIYLTCLGVGMGNYKDSKLEVLARRGNGNFAYIDDQKEAEKVLLHEFTETLYAVADDAYADVRFNPDIVKDYRLIGFDNNIKALADSTTELEGGEIGSGHSLLAMFEITPTQHNLDLISSGKKGIAAVELHYKHPNDTVSRNSYFQCPFTLIPFNELQPVYRFACSMVMFGDLMRKSKYIKMVDWNDVIELASHSYDHENDSQKEFMSILAKAKKIYAKDKRKKKKQE